VFVVPPVLPAVTVICASPLLPLLSVATALSTCEPAVRFAMQVS
jgi:hypothetical protein